MEELANWKLLKSIFLNVGLSHIYRKFILLKDDNVKHPSGFLWIIAIY